MKRFKFTLQSVYAYKQTVERVQRADLSRAQAELRALMEQDRQLDLSYARTQGSLNRALEEGADVVREMERHDAYFRFLRDKKKELKPRIKRAEAEQDRRRELLIQTMREIKTYEKLKAEQYADYRREVAEEESLEMNDFVSFTAGSGGAV